MRGSHCSLACMSPWFTHDSQPIETRLGSPIRRSLLWSFFSCPFLVPSFFFYVWHCLHRCLNIVWHVRVLQLLSLFPSLHTVLVGCFCLSDLHVDMVSVGSTSAALLGLLSPGGIFYLVPDPQKPTESIWPLGQEASSFFTTVRISKTLKFCKQISDTVTFVLFELFVWRPCGKCCKPLRLWANNSELCPQPTPEWPGSGNSS